MKLTYRQLRDILALPVISKNFEGKLEDILAGEADLTIVGFAKMLAESRLDEEIVQILTGKDISEVDAIQGGEALANFIEFIKKNKDKFSFFVKIFGFKKAKQGQSISGNGSKKNA